MGINAALNPLLSELAKRVKFSGVVCTLGVMELDSGGDPRAYFSRLDFSTLQALDISDFEGADHIFDLNEDELPERLVSQFDAVFNGGTLEHVFHVPNALTSITRMLRPGGVVVHVLPCNGWVNHGFYQISPTLMFDYYTKRQALNHWNRPCIHVTEPRNERIRIVEALAQCTEPIGGTGQQMRDHVEPRHEAHGNGESGW